MVNHTRAQGLRISCTNVCSQHCRRMQAELLPNGLPSLIASLLPLLCNFRPMKVTDSAAWNALLCLSSDKNMPFYKTRTVLITILSFSFQNVNSCKIFCHTSMHAPVHSFKGLSSSTWRIVLTKTKSASQLTVQWALPLPALHCLVEYPFSALYILVLRTNVQMAGLQH